MLDIPVSLVYTQHMTFEGFDGKVSTLDLPFIAQHTRKLSPETWKRFGAMPEHKG